MVVKLKRIESREVFTNKTGNRVPVTIFPDGGDAIAVDCKNVYVWMASGPKALGLPVVESFNRWEWAFIGEDGKEISFLTAEEKEAES